MSDMYTYFKYTANEIAKIIILFLYLLSDKKKMKERKHNISIESYMGIVICDLLEPVVILRSGETPLTKTRKVFSRH